MKLTLPSKVQVIRGCLGIAGTILIGALGSGVWQSLLAPAFHAGGRWLLDIAALGFRNFKDGVYEQIAVGNDLRPMIEGLMMSTATFVYVVAGFFLYGFSVIRKTTTQARHSLRFYTEPLRSTLPKEPPTAMLTDMIKRLGRLRLYLYGLGIIVCLVLTFQTVAFAKDSYINSAEAHYRHVLQIAAPFLDIQEQREVESQFAQINSRDGYLRLVSKLEETCRVHGQAVPAFDAW